MHSHHSLDSRHRIRGGGGGQRSSSQWVSPRCSGLQSRWPASRGCKRGRTSGRRRAAQSAGQPGWPWTGRAPGRSHTPPTQGRGGAGFRSGQRRRRYRAVQMPLVLNATIGHRSELPKGPLTPERRNLQRPWGHRILRMTGALAEPHPLAIPRGAPNQPQSSNHGRTCVLRSLAASLSWRRVHSSRCCSASSGQYGCRAYRPHVPHSSPWTSWQSSPRGQIPARVYREHRGRSG